MTVADLFKPVSTTPRRTDAVAPVLLGALGLAAALWLWTGRSVATQVAQDEDLAEVPGLLAVTEQVGTLSDRLGLTSLRGSLRRIATPLHDSPRVGRAPPPEPTVVAPPPPEPEPEAGPGAAWRSPAIPGGPRVERLVLVGASSVQYALGTELERRLEAEYDVDVTRFGKLGTGLTRDDVFDWRGKVRELVETQRPQVVVAQFGGNDCQPIVSPETGRHAFGTAGWDQEFTRRIAGLAADVQAGGAALVFLGMPPMRESGFSGRIAHYNQVARAAVEEAGGRWVELWDLAGDADGNYQLSRVIGGRTVKLRMGDGVHFTRKGAEALAGELVRRLDQRMTLLPRDEALAVSVGGTVDSALREERVPWMAFVPREVPDEGLPAVLLLHGAWGSWTDWSEHHHQGLAALSEELGLVLVLPDARPFGWYLDSPLVADNQIARSFTDELLPAFEAELPVRSWHVTGLSMGGHGALEMAWSHPGRFASVSTLSAVTDLTEARTRSQLVELLGPYDADPVRWQSWSAEHRVTTDPSPLTGVPLLLACGEQDKWFSANQRFAMLLDAQGVAHTWEPGPGAHDWAYWTGQIERHLNFHAASVE